MSVTARLLLLLCLALTQDSTVSKPSSPCPTAFNYFFEKPAGWYGVITILPPAKFSEVNLVLNMTAPYDQKRLVEGGVGRVEILGGDAEVKAISDRAYRGEQHQIQYKVDFPPHSNDDDVPRVQDLVINGRSFCTNRQEYPDTKSKINLHYTLTTGLTLAPAPGNQFSVVGSAPLQTATQTSWTQPPIPYQEPITVTQTRRPESRPKRPKTTTTPAYEYEEEYDQDKEPEFHVDGLNCGVPTLRGNFLILGGVEAVKGDWPWQAAMYKVGAERRFQCGGTLISNRHVITAAHCVYVRHKQKVVASNTLRIYLGKHSLSTKEDGQLEKHVERIILHPKYGSKKLDYDVAILILSTTVVFSEQIIAVCLWDRSPSLNEVRNKPGTVVGWGRDDEGNVAKELRVAKMPVVSQEECLRSDDSYQQLTSNVTYCAGFRNGTSACNGDSGGGMFFHMDNPKQNIKTWYIRGVVSLSKLDVAEHICDTKHYVVFTDLAKMLPWLRHQLAPLH